MQFEDVRKLATGTVLFNLNRIIAPRLMTILYFLGLAAILLWAVNHFFYTFRFGFGNGLWGILEILVFGLTALVVLRVACEAVIVFFRAHHTEASQASQPHAASSLIDDVRGAIEELAVQEDETVTRPAPGQAAQPAKSMATDTATTAKKSPSPRPAAAAGTKKTTATKAPPKKRAATGTKPTPPKTQ